MRTGRLLALAFLFAAAGPSLAADLDQAAIIGEWRRDDAYRQDEARVVDGLYGPTTVPANYSALTFGADGIVEYLGVAAWEGLSNSAKYAIRGSTLTFDLGPWGAGDGWGFPNGRMIDGMYYSYDTSRLICTIALAAERLSLSDCTAFNDAGVVPLAIPDTVWSRPTGAE